MTTAAELIAHAMSFNGTKIPTPDIDFAQDFSCGIFTDHVYRDEGMDHENNSSPSVQMQWFRARNQLFTTPQVGDQFFIDLTGQGRQAFHTGFVKELLTDGKFRAVDNNGAPLPNGYRGVTDQHIYDPVQDPPTFTLGFGRPAYSESTGGGSMLDVYVAVGHGIEPNGVYDPGAVAADGTQEHTLATAVCTATAAALNRCGVNFAWESNAGAGHDPDFIGSVTTVNQLMPKVAVEVHFDANNAPRGGFGLYYDDNSQGKRLSDLIMAAFGRENLPQRASYATGDNFYFIRGTKMPAIIWECDRTMAQPDVTVLIRMGEAIAEGLCEFLGVNYVPASNPGGPVQQDFHYVLIGDPVSQYEPPEGGVLMLTDKGYVYAWGHAKFWGGPGGNDYWEAQGHVGAKIKKPDPTQPNETGPHYVVVATSGDKYNY